MIYTAPVTRSGKPAGFRGVIIDITDQKHAEEKIKESEERFRTLADAALEGIMIHDNGIIADCNPQFANMFGYTPEEIIGRNGFEFMMTAESRDAISRWIQNGAKGTIDVTGIKKDGTRFYGETASTAILFQGKQHTIVQMHDITARKESEQTLNLTIESANLGMWDVNLVTHRQVHNRLWIEMLGYSTEEIDKPFDWWQEHIHPDDVPGVIESFENHLTGRAYNIRPVVSTSTNIDDSSRPRCRQRLLNCTGRVACRNRAARGVPVHGAGCLAHIYRRPPCLPGKQEYKEKRMKNSFH
jgi:PAS domain S-box-containing protein